MELIQKFLKEVAKVEVVAELDGLNEKGLYKVTSYWYLVKN